MTLLPEEGILLRIFISETAKYGNHNLYEAIVYKAQELGMAGATVFRGIMGFQAGHEMQTSKILRLSENLPVVIEIVDTKEKTDTLLPHLEEMVKDGLITSERANIIKAVKKN